MLRSGSEPACEACGRLLGQRGAGCQSCVGKGIPHIERVVRLAVYEGAVRRLVLAMKFERRWSVGTYLGRLLAARADVAALASAADVVVPVPLHRWRHLGRGFNQAEVIARAMAAGKCARLLSRPRATAVQSRQSSATARARNVKGAFARAWRADVTGKRVLLVDDLLTTGATIEEAARTLKRAGAARVDVAVVAIPDHRKERPELGE